MALNFKRRPLPTSVDPIFGENADPAELPHVKFSEMRPYHNHRFRLYTGRRLQEMADSIFEYGLLTPPIILELPEPEGEIRYEILSGHNRINAARLVGYTEAPCIIKKDLTEDEAKAYVVITNLFQRSFSEMVPSEQAEVLSTQYITIANQGKRNDIMNELRKLEGLETPTDEADEQKTPGKSRDAVGELHSLSGSTVARLMRIAQLTPDLQRRVDDKDIDITAAVQLSYLPKEQQSAVELALAADPVKIDLKKAKQLRDMNKAGKLTEDSISRILTGTAKTGKKPRGKLPNIVIKPKIYSKYLTPGLTAEELEAEVEKALAAYAEAMNSRKNAE